LHPDLVLREVPGNLVERSPYADRRRPARYKTLRRISWPIAAGISGRLFSRRRRFRPLP